MSIVKEIYSKNIDITDIELAEEILKYQELTSLDLWLLPQYPFNLWRREHDYPRLLENIKNNQSDFKTWMTEQGITDEHLLNGYFSDYFENKTLSKERKRHLIKVTYKGKESYQSWDSYNVKKSCSGDVEYEFIKEYISYYDWKLFKGERFSFINTFERYDPNTEDENVFLNHNIKLLKMGGMRPPVNSVGMLLRSKKLDFINVSGLDLRGTISCDITFLHCAVDNLKCNELDMGAMLSFQNCSIRNMQVRNSYLQRFFFLNSMTTGNIIDSKLSAIQIYGGKFNPLFTNSEIDEIEVQHEGVISENDFDKTYRSLAKCAKESGNNELYNKLKIQEYDFIRLKSKGIKKILKTIDKFYWEYGHRPKKLIYITLITIILGSIMISSCY